MVNIGQTMSFIPHWRISAIDDEAAARRKTITGKVIYVDRAHKKFAVKYSCGGTTMRETFKFADIGSAIHKIGGEKNGR